MRAMASVLVVDDDRNILTTTSITLRREGHEVASAETFSEAEDLIGNAFFDVVITDLRLEDGKSGIDVLKTCKATSPEASVIVITAFSSMESAITAMREGASDYVVKPCGPDQIILSVNRVLEKKELLTQIHSLQRQVDTYSNDGIVSKSPVMQKVLEDVYLVANTDSTVLITGETGTGKELVANLIQNRSRLRDKPFLALSCAALPENLLESELFGHVKGAFSGAITNKKGLVQEANQGTLFLDEIGEMSTFLQAKLLRFIEQKEVRPVGSNKNIYVKVRLIAATNKDLAQAVRNKEFRSDLYYRLKVVSINLPPLRDRTQDIALLVKKFLLHASEESNASNLVLSKEAITRLKNYHWPGNIRELRHTIEAAVILGKGPLITENDLDIPDEIQPPLLESPHSSLALADASREHLLDVLERCNWNQKRATEVLKISKATLWRKLKAYGIDIKAIRKSQYPYP
jgi:DNA-binding NtrC family response regulator